MPNLIKRAIDFIKGTQNVVNGPAMQNGGFRLIGGNLVPYSDSKISYIHKAYMYNDMNYSVVKIILDKAAQAPFAPYIIEDEQKFMKYSQVIGSLGKGAVLDAKQYAELKNLRHKAISLFTADDYLTELMEWPNDNECMSDHNYGLWGYKLVTGDFFEAGWTPWDGGFNRGKPMGMYGIPSQFTSILASSGSLPLTDAGYLLQVGTEIPFTKEDVLHEKYWNPEWDVYGSQLYGMSPVRAGLKRIQRNNLVQIRGAKAAENAGADVVVYMDNPEVLKSQGTGAVAFDQMRRMKNTWDNEQAGVSNAGKAVWSAYKMGVARLGLSPVELDLLESENADLRHFCNAYGVPSQLLNDASNKTYNNQAEGEKALILRCVMPLLISRQRNFNRKLRSLPAYKGKRIVCEFDVTAYSELEQNKTELLTWLNKSALPLRRWYELMNEDIPAFMTDEQLNTILIPSGTTTLNDILAATPVSIPPDPNALNTFGQ